MDLEPVQPRNELIGWFGWAELWVYHEQHVGEPGTEIDAIDVMVTRRLGRVDITALGTVQFHHGLTRDIRKT